MCNVFVNVFRVSYRRVVTHIYIRRWNNEGGKSTAAARQRNWIAKQKLYSCLRSTRSIVTALFRTAQFSHRREPSAPQRRRKRGDRLIIHQSPRSRSTSGLPLMPPSRYIYMYIYTTCTSLRVFVPCHLLCVVDVELERKKKSFLG